MITENDSQKVEETPPSPKKSFTVPRETGQPPEVHPSIHRSADDPTGRKKSQPFPPTNPS